MSYRFCTAPASPVGFRIGPANRSKGPYYRAWFSSERHPLRQFPIVTQDSSERKFWNSRANCLLRLAPPHPSEAEMPRIPGGLAVVDCDKDDSAPPPPTSAASLWARVFFHRKDFPTRFHVELFMRSTRNHFRDHIGFRLPCTVFTMFQLGTSQKSKEKKILHCKPKRRT